MEQYWNKFRDLLRENGLSITTPRREVFESLYSFGLQTMTQLIQRCNHSDRASIYRAVTALESVGAIIRVPSGFRYKLELSDAFLPHHHHITCIQCGKSTDIEQTTLEQLLTQIAENEQYLLTGHRLELSGLCGSCQPANP